MKKRITLQRASLFLLILQIFILLFAFLLGSLLLAIPFLSWLGTLIFAIWCYFSEYFAIPVGIMGAVLELICMVRTRRFNRFPLLLAHPVIGYFAWRWFQALMSV